MKVRFTHTQVVEVGHPAPPGQKREVFSAGDVYDLPESSALRWIRRGVAEAVADAPTPAAPVKPKTKPKSKH